MRIHRKYFILKKSSCLCLAHFDESCFIKKPTLFHKGQCQCDWHEQRIPQNFYTIQDTLVSDMSPLTEWKWRRVSAIHHAYKLNVWFPYDCCDGKDCCSCCDRARKGQAIAMIWVLNYYDHCGCLTRFFGDRSDNGEQRKPGISIKCKLACKLHFAVLSTCYPQVCKLIKVLFYMGGFLHGIPFF